MSEDRYLNSSQQRLMGLILVLAGHEIEGLAPAQIAKANGCGPSQVTRDLANLKARGWAEQIVTTDRWRLGPQIVQVSMQHAAALNRARTRLDEVAGRYSRMG